MVIKWEAEREKVRNKSRLLWAVRGKHSLLTEHSKSYGINQNKTIPNYCTKIIKVYHAH